MGKRGPIGVFDSGFGGLTIFRHIARKFPDYDYIYLGDSARVPYGTRSKDIIKKFTSQAVDFLFNNNCQLIIIACNTASADALRFVQKHILLKKYPDRKILGVLIPAAEKAAEVTKNKKIGIIATPATVSSNAFKRELKKLDTRIQVYQKSCPLLVPIIESGNHNHKIAEIVLKECWNTLKKKNIDTLILGCTHYEVLKKNIKKIVGNNVKIIFEGPVVAEKLSLYLENHKEIENNISRNRNIKFITTDLTDNFTKLGQLFYKDRIIPEVVSLDIS